ncbi:MAG: hypothetical protein A2X79_08055 [Desulfuromonadaceae bacterium GWB2_53_15]|nr:MAG: hypothetical protein A2X83_06345 [Desulfuromonadales bacterium GWD2_54_10]OHB27352.1 MAG: hypothetical protein A2X79_08055 [Desulfuromonadaceae bacterium GWB2_53_15]
MKAFINRFFGDSEDTQLVSENTFLREQQFKQVEYIRRKTNQLLMLMGTLPIRPEELNDDTLIEIDPIGTVADAFAQILEHEKDLNERLRMAHDEIQAILSSVGVGIMLLDSSMQIQMYNQKVVELFSLNEQTLIGQTCCQAVCGMSTLPANCTYARILETRRPYHQSDWVQAGRHFDVSGVPIKNRYGDVTHVVLAYTETTNRVETERILREREQICLDVFENISDIVQCVTPDGSFLFVNRAWRETLGYEPHEIVGLKFWNIIAPEGRKECMEHFGILMHGTRLEGVRTNLLRKDGKEIPVEGQINCSFSNGRPIATFGLFRLLEQEKGNPLAES